MKSCPCAVCGGSRICQFVWVKPSKHYKTHSEKKKIKKKNEHVDETATKKFFYIDGIYK